MFRIPIVLPGKHNVYCIEVFRQCNYLKLRVGFKRSLCPEGSVISGGLFNDGAREFKLDKGLNSIGIVLLAFVQDFDLNVGFIIVLGLHKYMTHNLTFRIAEDVASLDD